MRFSLFTLVLLSLWIGTGMLVWQRREPWVLLHGPYESAWFPKGWDSSSHRVSPDRTRYVQGLSVDEMMSERFTEIYDAADDSVLYRWFGLPDSEADGKRYLNYPETFLNDNQLVINYGTLSSTSTVILVRRHPEWWWGHFYRPEVWALIALTVFLLVFAVRRRLKRPIESA